MKIDDRHKRVLVVDDEEEVCRILVKTLCLCCDDVVFAHSAEEGERMISGDLTALLTDYDMPGKDGVWLLEQVRERHPGVFRAMISGRPPADLERHMESGLIQDFTMKPDLPVGLMDYLDGK